MWYVSSRIFEYRAILKKICLGNLKRDLTDNVTHKKYVTFSSK